MADSLVSLFKATYSRLGGDDATAVVAAMLDKSEGDVVVRALAIVFYIARANPAIPASDLLDLALAQAADQEAVVEPSSSLQVVADYMAPNLATEVQPMPRILLQPLSVSLVKLALKPSRIAAMQFLLTTYQFE